MYIHPSGLYIERKKCDVINILYVGRSAHPIWLLWLSHGDTHAGPKNCNIFFTEPFPTQLGPMAWRMISMLFRMLWEIVLGLLSLHVTCASRLSGISRFLHHSLVIIIQCARLLITPPRGGRKKRIFSAVMRTMPTDTRVLFHAMPPRPDGLGRNISRLGKIRIHAS